VGPSYPGETGSVLTRRRHLGQPLSLRGLDKIIAQIIVRHPEFSGVLTPHTLRHTANDSLSEALERNGCSIEEAAEVRNYLMGWSPTSQQGAKYTRRYIEAKAQEILLDHQRRIFSECDL
jgi:integrase